jgi:hypothetical protein
MGFVSLPHPAPSARENLFFDIVLWRRKNEYDLYGKYDKYDKYDLYDLYDKYDKFWGQNRHFWQLSPTRRDGYE